MPAGTTAPTLDDATPNPAGGPCGRPDASTLATAAGRTASVFKVFFAPGSAGNNYDEASYSEEIVAFPSTRAAKHYVAKLRSEVVGCKVAYAAPNSVDGASTTVKLVATPKRGDESFAADAVTTSNGPATPTKSEGITVRVGNHVLNLGVTTGEATFAQMPVSLTLLTRKAVTQLDNAIKHSKSS